MMVNRLDTFFTALVWDFDLSAGAPLRRNRYTRPLTRLSDFASLTYYPARTWYTLQSQLCFQRRFINKPSDCS